MKTAIIVHGTFDTREEYLQQYECGPMETDSHWMPWLARNLILNDIQAQRPEMPHPYDKYVKYSEWAETIGNFKINKDTVLIGHSAGTGFLLKYLAEHPEMRVGKLVLVAPWVDPTGINGDFMKGWDSDPNLINRAGGVDMIYSTDDINHPDKMMIIDSVKQIVEKYGNEPNFRIHKFENKGHFTRRIGREFPELLEAIIGKTK